LEIIHAGAEVRNGEGWRVETGREYIYTIFFGIAPKKACPPRRKTKNPDSYRD
jgi:hypothetical protein